MKKNILFLTTLLILASSCKKQQYAVSSMTGSRTEITSDFDNQTSPQINDLINKYKDQVDNKMNQVIGESTQEMTLGRPQSLLTNLTSDVMLEFGKDLFNGNCDLALMNVHGHRADMPKGDIRVGNIFEIYSFDNTLTIIKIKGKYVKQLFESYAQMGGAGISGNAKLIIKDKKIVSALIDGKPVDDERIYTIVTLDYLADGNDGMDAMMKSESIEQPGTILREYMLDYITKQTKAGKKITSVIDDRIIIQ